MTLTEREVAVKVKFDFAHLAESILAESRDLRQSPPSSSSPVQGSSAVTVSRTCPLGGNIHPPLAPSSELTAKRHGRRTRLTMH